MIDLCMRALKGHLCDSNLRILRDLSKKFTDLTQFTDLSKKYFMKKALNTETRSDQCIAVGTTLP